MPDTIHTELLANLRRALRKEQSLTVSVAGEIVEAGRFLAPLYAAEREAERRLSAWPRDPAREAMSAEEQNAMNLGEDDQRRAARQAERLANREAVREQAIRRLASDARAAGADPAVAVAQYVASSAGPDHQACQDSWQAAVQARQRGERALAELEAERSLHGKRGGQLRQTLQEAEAWMRSQGLATEDLAA